MNQQQTEVCVKYTKEVISRILNDLCEGAVHWDDIVLSPLKRPRLFGSHTLSGVIPILTLTIFLDEYILFWLAHYKYSIANLFFAWAI